MKRNPCPWHEVIISLGGTGQLARDLSTKELHLTTAHIAYWWRDGIPTKWHDAVQELRAAKGLPRAPREAFPKMVAPPSDVRATA